MRFCTVPRDTRKDLARCATVARALDRMSEISCRSTSSKRAHPEVSARPGRDCGGWHIASQGWHFAQRCQQIKQISGFFLAAEEIENDYRRWPEFESSARLARRHERPSPSQKL